MWELEGVKGEECISENSEIESKHKNTFDI
jgi:hypothetical protein